MHIPFLRAPFWQTVFLFLLALTFLFVQQAHAQYAVNGDAAQLSCNCYRLTGAFNDQGGSVWNVNQISLEAPFDFTFDVYLGDEDQWGADGIAFVLQQVDTAAGDNGGGLGYFGLSPSVAIEIDTHDNGVNGEIASDHIAIQANGDVAHNTVNNLAGPVAALAASPNIEDGQTHLMRVVWDPLTLTLEAYMDQSLRVSYTGDMVAEFFNNDPMVFWGFTGGTGGLNNLQQFCLSIIPEFTTTTEEMCEGESAFFEDDSYSALGDVVAWNWNFGNGITSTEENPGEISFTNPGTFTVVQTITDAAGCMASDQLEITVNPKPNADFTATQVCQGNATQFVDQSTASTGWIDIWNWEINGTTEFGNTVSTTYPQGGTYNVILEVTSNNGCVSSVQDSVTVFENPVASTTNQNAGFDVVFNPNLLAGETADWLINNELFFGANPINYTFLDSGWYAYTLTVTNSNNCFDVLEDSVYVEAIPEYMMPNVFTPNQDDINDFFQPESYAMIEANLNIYNRWGRPVFAFGGNIPQDDSWGWNGSDNGNSQASEGTYFYLLEMVGINGVNYTEQGAVTLIR